MGEGQFRDPNRRAFARTAVRQPATVVHGDTTVGVQTLDVGPGGVSFLAPRPIAPGTRCTVEFALPFADGPMAVRASLKVVYSSYLAHEQFKIGTVFTVLDDDTAAILIRYTDAAS
jgi:hypothetical protein